MGKKYTYMPHFIIISICPGKILLHNIHSHSHHKVAKVKTKLKTPESEVTTSSLVNMLNVNGRYLQHICRHKEKVFTSIAKVNAFSKGLNDGYRH